MAERGKRTVMYSALAGSCASALAIRDEGDALVVVTHASNVATILCQGVGGYDIRVELSGCADVYCDNG